MARTTRWSSSPGTAPAPSPVTWTTSPEPVSSASSSSRRSRARPSESKPGPRFAEVAGTVTRAIRTGPSSEPCGPGRLGDIGVDHGLDDRPEPLERRGGVLEAVAGDGDDDGAAGVRVTRGEVGEQASDAGGRGGLDEDAVPGGEL